MEEVWKRRRFGVSYGVPGHRDDDDEDEIKSTDSNEGKCKRCKGAVYRFIRSIGFYDEDELLFIHSSVILQWELLEKGTGRFSLALDYLVYRSFYALILTGLVIYSAAVRSNDLETYPVILFASTGVHIVYSLLYTLHIVSGKTHRAKVHVQDTDLEGQLQLEDHVDENPTHPHPVVPPAQVGSLEDLTRMDIQNIITTKPHPITFPDRVIWLLFNIFAALQLSIAIISIFVTGFGNKKGQKLTPSLQDVVFIIYGAVATLIDLGVNCIPLRIVHCIYSIIIPWLYALYTYLSQYYMEAEDEFVEDRLVDWKNNPNETWAFFVGSSIFAVVIHIIISAIAYCRNKAICIFSRPAVVESVLGKQAEVINELIDKDKSVKKFVDSPNFVEAFQEEQIEELRLAKEREAKEERKRERVVKVYEKGAEVFEELLFKAREKVGASETALKSVTPSVKASIKASFRRSVYRPYSSDMTIDEFLENLTRDPNDGIVRMKKPEIKGGLPPDFDWVKEKQKPQEKVPISGIKKEFKAKKWNEFYTPPDSLQELTLKSRHQERGRGKNYAQLETYNEKLLNIPIFHHVTPGPLRKVPEPEDLSTRKRKHSEDTEDDNDEGKPKPKSRPLTAQQTLFKQKLKEDLRKETIKGEPQVLANKAGKSVPQGKYNVTMTSTGGKSKSTKSPRKAPVSGAPRMSLTGIKVHENWVPFIPPKIIEPPKLKWFLGDTSFMPVPMPPPPPVIPPSPSGPTHLDKKTLLENEKAKIEMELKEKLKPPKIQEKLRELRIRQSIREEEQRRASEMEQQKHTETEDSSAQSMASARNHFAVSAYIREQTKRMELKEARLKAKMEKNRRPHFIALNINKKTEVSDEKALLRKRRLRLQQEKSRRLAYEQMRKPRQTMIFDDIDNSHANNQLVPLLLLNVDENAKQEILSKPQSQGILKNKDNKDSDTTKSHATIMPGLEKVSTTLANRDLRSNLQLHGRALARGPMADSVYHPLKIPKKGTTPHVLTYHYLDDKLPHTGGQRTVEQSELVHYHHHPGTHVHHPILNLEHSEGPHESLRSALKEHVSSKVKDLHRHRYTHPALEPRSDLPAESAKKDVSHENPFRVIAFHPIVQYRSVQEKGPSEPAIKSSIAPKAKESYPREELKRLEEEHSDDSIKSAGSGRQRQATGYSEKKKSNQLKNLLAGPLKPAPLVKPKKPGYRPSGS